MINPETQVVSTSHAGGVYTYVVAYGPKRWTVRINADDFERFGPMMGANARQIRENRRRHLAMRLIAAMDGPADAPPKSVKLLTHG